MKAISLWQPWATLIAIGAKRIETRAWDTKYRGPLAIHASKTDGRLPILGEAAAYDAMEAAGRARDLRTIPHGAVVAVCDLVATIKVEAGTLWPQWVGRRSGWIDDLTIPPQAPELYYGDYTTGRFAWLLDNVRELPTPVPFRGRQMFFDVPDGLLTARAGEAA